MKPVFRQLGLDFRATGRLLPEAFRSVRVPLLLALAGGALVTAGLSFWLDERWAGAGRAPFGEHFLPLARNLSYFGELHWIPLFTAVLVWTAGFRLNRERWRRAAVAALLAAVTAGLVAAMLKGLIGRARPDLLEPFTFIGPNRHADTQGFPSGHTTHCAAFAITLLLLAPELGVPWLAVFAAVVWARLALHKHYPSDIAGGFTLGLMGAIVVTTASRLAARRDAGEKTVSV